MTFSHEPCVLVWLASTLLVAGCATANAGSVHNVQVSATFDTEVGTATTCDTALVPVGAQGSVASTCGAAGGADPRTEIRLDLTTDGSGAGSASTTVP